MSPLRLIVLLALSPMLCAAGPTWKSHEACLLARPGSEVNKHDLRSCLDQWGQYGEWAPVWCAAHTFYREGRHWKHPRDCYANCASCLQAGVDSGADAAFCFRRAGFHAYCQTGYTRRRPDNVYVRILPSNPRFEVSDEMLMIQ